MASDRTKIDKVTYAMTGEFFVGQRVRVAGNQLGTVVPNAPYILGLAANDMRRYVRVEIDDNGGKWHFFEETVRPL